MNRVEATRIVRSFSRIVPERLGALTDDFLGRHRPMGEARILWEIGPRGADVRELRTRLNLDSGYATRVLRALERDGLITVAASPRDGRVRHVRLTARGRAERAELDRRSDRIAANLLEPLNEEHREALVTAMAQVERLLTASMVVIAVEDPASSDAVWCLDRYFAELDSRFDGGFDPDAGISANPDELVPPSGEMLVARLRGKPVACGALKLHAGAPAEIKRMWVSPEARGLGMGRRMLATLERHAFEAGARVTRLETNRALREAISLYRSSGYREVPAFNDEPHAHHWFEKRLSRRAVR